MAASNEAAIRQALAYGGPTPGETYDRLDSMIDGLDALNKKLSDNLSAGAAAASQSDTLELLKLNETRQSLLAQIAGYSRAVAQEWRVISNQLAEAVA